MILDQRLPLGEAAGFALAISTRGDRGWRGGGRIMDLRVMLEGDGGELGRAT